MLKTTSPYVGTAYRVGGGPALCQKTAIGRGAAAALPWAPLGEGLVREGRPAEAIALFTPVPPERRGDFDLHMGLGTAHYLQGNLHGALVFFARAARLRPDAVEPHLRSAQCHMTLGLGVEAAASWRRVLELDPGREGVAEIIRLLESGPVESGPGPN